MSMKKGVETLISLKSEIQAQKEGQDKVEQFCFENINIGVFSEDLMKLISKYQDLKTLEFNECNLTNIDCLCGLENVVRLRLRNNSLNVEALKHLVKNFPKLEYLDISGNKELNQIEDLKILNQLKSLKNLVINSSQRDELFKLLEWVQVIDQMDRKGEQINDDDEDEEDDDEDDDEDEDDDDEDDEEDEDDVDNDDIDQSGEDNVRKIAKV